jgi:CubicO group peptidase (beta-lactamase class C family)
MRFLLTSLAIIALLAPAASAQTPAQIDRVAADAMRQWKLPGIAIAVVKDDKVVLTRGYGVRELGGTAPVNDETLFEIASTSKAFTSAGLGLLADEKKLSWDDPVRQHLDYFHLDDPCADSLVTVRDLLSHRTGLTRHDELWDNTALTREEIIRAAGRVRLTKPIRTTYQYSNIMFMTAGEVLAHAAGMPWDAFLRKRIFEPLGMSRTVTTYAELMASTNHASSHHYDAKGDALTVKPIANYDPLGPAGTIASCARDLAQWLRFQLSTPSEGIAETKTPQLVIPLKNSAREVYPDANLLAYGMGWNIHDYFGSQIVSHAGALNRMRTQVALLPREHAGVAVLIHTDRGLAAAAVRATLTDLLLGRTNRDWNAYFLAVEKKQDAKAEQQKRDREAKRKRDTHPSHDLAAYAGTYTSPAYGTLTITNDSSGLVLHWQRLTLPLTHWQYDSFSAFSEEDDVDETVTFRTGADGEVNTLTMWDEDFTRPSS